MNQFLVAFLEVLGIFAIGVLAPFIVGVILRWLAEHLKRFIFRSGWFSALALLGCSAGAGPVGNPADSGGIPDAAEDACALCDCYAAPECSAPELACACPSNCVTGPMGDHAACAYVESNDGVSYFCCE